MKRIELEVPIDEMDEADLRATFAEVMEAHEENVAEFSEQAKELEAAQAAAEAAKDLEAQVSDFRAYFAEKGEAVTGIDQEVLAERFEPAELVEFAQKYDEEAVEAGEEGGEEAEFSEDDETEEDASIFANRPSKVGDFSADTFEERKEAAKERLKGLGGIALD